MKNDEITQEIVQEYFDYHDGRLYWRKTTNSRIKIGDRFGCESTSNQYRVGGFFGKMWKDHRLIWLYHNVDIPKFLDHKDRDRSNNKIENLRPATSQQNQQNRSGNKNNTSGIRGVSLYNVITKSGTYKYWVGIYHDKDGKRHTKSFPHTFVGMLLASAYYQTNRIKF